MYLKEVKNNLFGLIKKSRELRTTVSVLEKQFAEDIQFSADQELIAICQGQIRYYRSQLEKCERQMEEIREMRSPETLKAWREEWYAQEKAVTAATETAAKILKPSVSDSMEISLERMITNVNSRFV